MITLVNVYVALLVFTPVAGSSSNKYLKVYSFEVVHMPILWNKMAGPSM